MVSWVRQPRLPLVRPAAGSFPLRDWFAFCEPVLFRSIPLRLVAECEVILMPLYEYSCVKCGPFIDFQTMNRWADPTDCPDCGDPSERSVSSPQIALAMSQRFDCEAQRTTSSGFVRVSRTRWQCAGAAQAVDLPNVSCWHQTEVREHVRGLQLFKSMMKSFFATIWLRQSSRFAHLSALCPSYGL